MIEKTEETEKTIVSAKRNKEKSDVNTWIDLPKINNELRRMKVTNIEEARKALAQLNEITDKSLKIADQPLDKKKSEEDLAFDLTNTLYFTRLKKDLLVKIGDQLVLHHTKEIEQATKPAELLEIYKEALASRSKDELTREQLASIGAEVTKQTKIIQQRNF